MFNSFARKLDRLVEGNGEQFRSAKAGAGHPTEGQRARPFCLEVRVACLTADADAGSQVSAQTCFVEVDMFGKRVGKPSRRRGCDSA